MDLDRFMEETREAILDNGFAVHYDDRPSKIYRNLPRAYTAGRSLFDRPELLIVGPFTHEDMTRLLTELTEIDLQEPFAPNQTVRVERLFHLIEADPSAFIGAQAMFGHLQGLQALWADESGSFDHPDTQPTRPRGVIPLQGHDPYGPPDPFFPEEGE